MKHYYLLFAFLFSFSLSNGQTLEDDRLALIALYNSSGGAGWYNKTGWTVPGAPGDNPCSWAGVSCSGDRVTNLSLPANDMLGSIPPEIGNLTALVYLDLSGPGREFFNLTGSIPLELGNLVNLEYLDLKGNAFSGSNVAPIGNLVKLKHLALTPDWAIPSEFGNLINLEYLFLSVLDQSGLGPLGQAGNIPSSFGNLVKLKTLDMHYSGATGTIPSTLGNLVNLEILDLHSNKLAGDIPTSFVNLTKLATLNLSDNLLNGTIPNLSGIPLSAIVNINSNSFTFLGMEGNMNYLDSYSPQAKIPLNISSAFPLPYIISVDAGGTIRNNTYKFFKDGELIVTKVGESTQFIYGGGLFRIEVTNRLIPGLTLYSKEVFIDLGPMPVTLTSFTGKPNSSANLLTWQTTSETNNKGFQIEKSMDAKSFETIGFVEGAGDRLGDKLYHFSDTKPFSKTYYRLKQIDWDSKSEYSRIIAVTQEHEKISAYPNPATNQFFFSGLDKAENVELRNIEGRVVLKQHVNAEGPVYTGHLSNGLYFIKVREETMKIVIQN